ncbi:CRISPR-associated endonuclease Cas2 [Thiothrix litoralis]|jgi:CRISPR-associated protein Cas2|uniref:CRISPR-associated endoribonuclease Cas2 n=1 Tax=Thiothrix litoralis TaxID=2891210 RepID=A0ABX7WMD1_9GAMM|nr:MULTISPECIES: CRISPR-associated endonuclease Cas2 [Thiothrix]QTR44844.1 CRISPR-associated endonuclease Cas2 [Thiothrix litoralis]WMP16509.1 CRISPR-associated endonuclease Cas2 [Thiothrix lacustris]
MPEAARVLYLAAYDVSDAGRLRAALHCVRAYATGGQKSVHEVWLTDAEKGELIGDMSFILDEDDDSFMLIRLDPRQTVHTLGLGIAPIDPDWFYLG